MGGKADVTQNILQTTSLRAFSQLFLMVTQSVRGYSGQKACGAISQAALPKVSLNFFLWIPIPRTCPYTESLYSLVSGMASTTFTCYAYRESMGSSLRVHVQLWLPPPNPVCSFACSLHGEPGPLSSVQSQYLLHARDVRFKLFYHNLHTVKHMSFGKHSHLEEGLPRVCLLVPLIAPAI